MRHKYAEPLSHEHLMNWKYIMKISEVFQKF